MCVQKPLLLKGGFLFLYPNKSVLAKNLTRTLEG